MRTHSHIILIFKNPLDELFDKIMVFKLNHSKFHKSVAYSICVWYLRSLKSTAKIMGFFCSCRYDFCWVCLGPWEPHGSQWYNCNRYDEEVSKMARQGQQKSREDLERYLFYCNRYMNHNQSMKLENKLYAMVKVRRRFCVAVVAVTLCLFVFFCFSCRTPDQGLPHFSPYMRNL